MRCKFLDQAPLPGVESIATHFLQAGEPHEEVAVVTEAAELAPLAALVVIVVVSLSATIVTGCDSDLASS